MAVKTTEDLNRVMRALYERAATDQQLAVKLRKILAEIEWQP